MVTHRNRLRLGWIAVPGRRSARRKDPLMSTPAPSADVPPTPATTPADGAAPDAGELWWLGCHGGAGVSTLTYLTGVGTDCRQTLPRTDFDRRPDVAVILVCRATANGVAAAHHSMNSYLSWRHRPHLLGFVAVAAEAARPSRLVDERLRLLKAQAPRVWVMPWVGALNAVHDPAEVGAIPAYQRLAAELKELRRAPLGGHEAEAPTAAAGNVRA
jgi:hypothetical protein